MQLSQKKPGKVPSSRTQAPTRSSDSASIARTAINKVFQKRAGIEDAIPLPDETELERVRRKRAAKRAGGRESTVLTSDDNRIGG